MNITFIDASKDEDSIDDLVSKGKNYTIDDCILVRTTDIFPLNGVMRIPKKDNAYSFGDSSIMGKAIFEEIKEKYPNKSSEEQIEESKKYMVVFETCRSTLHFALNGLVSSHLYGDFNNRPYVVFEPLKFHIDDSLKSLRVEDVYFNEDIVLSNQASILISEEIYRASCSNQEYLETLKEFNIFIYRGNQKEAVRKVLKTLGYDSFVLNQHGYERGLDTGTAANEMWEFAYELSTKFGIGFDRYYGSTSFIEDIKARQEKSEEIDISHLKYILNNSLIPKYLEQKIEESLEEGIENNTKLEYLMTEFVKIVGLDRIRELTIQFNEEYISGLKNKSTQFKPSN